MNAVSRGLDGQLDLFITFNGKKSRSDLYPTVQLTAEKPLKTNVNFGMYAQWN